MNWIDGTLIVLMIVSIITGLQMGFVRAAIGLLSAILALVFGLHYYPAVAVSLRPHIAHSTTADLVAFMIIFVGITMLGEVVAGILRHFIRSVDLVWVDRVLGGAFGVVRGFLYGAVAIWALMAFMPVSPHVLISNSRLAPCVMDAARRVAEASPDEVRRTFRQSYRELNRVLPEKVKERFPNAGTAKI